VESLNKICGQLSQEQVETHFIPLTIRLSKADWFTSKISATGLYNVPYGKATPPSQEILRQQFGQLVHDDTPMVRRQAANNLAKFVKAMPAAIVIEEMIPLFQHLASDDQDSVRLLTVDVLIAVAEVVPKEQQSSHGVLLTALRSLFEDKSWRVRYMVADRFEKVHDPSATRSWTTNLVPNGVTARLPKRSMKRLCRVIWCLPLSSFSRTPKPKYEQQSQARSPASVDF
jgi:serine/threonine-protein phosphatase 2A regulatory subunit A